MSKEVHSMHTSGPQTQTKRMIFFIRNSRWHYLAPKAFIDSVRHECKDMIDKVADAGLNVDTSKLKMLIDFVETGKYSDANGVVKEAEVQYDAIRKACDDVSGKKKDRWSTHQQPPHQQHKTEIRSNQVNGANTGRSPLPDNLERQMAHHRRQGFTDSPILPQGERHTYGNPPSSRDSHRHETPPSHRDNPPSHREQQRHDTPPSHREANARQNTPPHRGDPYRHGTPPARTDVYRHATPSEKGDGYRHGTPPQRDSYPYAGRGSSPPRDTYRSGIHDTAPHRESYRQHGELTPTRREHQHEPDTYRNRDQGRHNTYRPGYENNVMPSARPYEHSQQRGDMTRRDKDAGNGSYQTPGQHSSYYDDFPPRDVSETNTHFGRRVHPELFFSGAKEVMERTRRPNDHEQLLFSSQMDPISHLQYESQDRVQSVKPNDLARQFDDVFKNEWDAAFKEISTMLGLERAIQTLLWIVTECGEICSDIAEYQMKDLEKTAQKVMAHPEVSKDSTDLPLEQETVPTAKNFLTKYRKQSAQMSFPYVSQLCLDRIRRHLQESPSSNLIRDAHSLKEYIRKCAQVTWLMSVQDPPVVMEWVTKDQTGVKFDDELYRSFSDRKGNRYEYGVWPLLRVGKNGTVVYRGYAQRGTSVK